VQMYFEVRGGRQEPDMLLFIGNSSESVELEIRSSTCESLLLSLLGDFDNILQQTIHRQLFPKVSQVDWEAVQTTWLVLSWHKSGLMNVKTAMLHVLGRI
jgi:hypothetical protein